MQKVDKNYCNKWSDFTLILPAVSVGNVGQLAVDLLLSTLNVQHVGYLDDSSVLPIAGPDPFDRLSTRLITSWEVYECKEKKLVIVQQRSPVAIGKRTQYIQYLINWFKEENFNHVILLSSSFSQFISSPDLESTPIHYLCTSSAKPKFEVQLKGLQWKEFQLSGRTDANVESYIPGGGTSKHLLEECEISNIALVAVILACSEGNNYPEALQLVNKLNTWLELVKGDDSEKRWKIPTSWCLPFGNDPPKSMY